MQVENIKKFLQTAFTDERLAALLAHTQDGKLAFHSCCCLVGSATADHPLRGTDFSLRSTSFYTPITVHLGAARNLRFAKAAEEEFGSLLDPGQKVEPFSEELAEVCSAQRRKYLIPLILEEMERREQLKAQGDMEEPEWSDSDTRREQLQDQLR